LISAKERRKQFLMEFLMGFWQCQVAIVWVALQKRGETKLRDF
jgi:hypothetical protein